MSKILVSGGLVPTTKDTLLDARTRVATFSDIANIENPARFMVITVEDTGKKYEVKKLSSKIIGGIVVENSTIDINDPEALVDLGLAEELRSEEEKVRQSNEKKRIEAENLRKSAEDSRNVNETNRVSAEGVREASEKTRVSSEETRNANEQTRNSNETKRQFQESTRQSQESARQNNESTRNTNESARKEAESERKTEETSRRTAELSRSSAENERVKNEQNRTTAENTRSSAEDRRVVNETQRTTNETARSNAELSREQAEGNRASTFNTLKGQMQTTIQEGQTAVAATEKATSDAQKVVDEYDTKVAEQDSKLTELGSEMDSFKEAVTDQVNQYKPIVINGNVTNAADEEDITSEDNLLKLKNRSALDGMGYVILRKDKTFAEQVTQDNTIYEIRYEFNLNNEKITIPEGCILDFQGGSLINGVLNCNETKFINPLLYDCDIKGSVVDSDFPAESLNKSIIPLIFNSDDITEIDLHGATITDFPKESIHGYRTKHLVIRNGKLVLSEDMRIGMKVKDVTIRLVDMEIIATSNESQLFMEYDLTEDSCSNNYIFENCIFTNNSGQLSSVYYGIAKSLVFNNCRFYDTSVSTANHWLTNLTWGATNRIWFSNCDFEWSENVTAASNADCIACGGRDNVFITGCTFNNIKGTAIDVYPANRVIISSSKFKDVKYCVELKSIFRDEEHGWETKGKGTGEYELCPSVTVTSCIFESFNTAINTTVFIECSEAYINSTFNEKQKRGLIISECNFYNKTTEADVSCIRGEGFRNMLITNCIFDLSESTLVLYGKNDDLIQDKLKGTTIFSNNIVRYDDGINIYGGAFLCCSAHEYRLISNKIFVAGILKYSDIKTTNAFLGTSCKSYKISIYIENTDCPATLTGSGTGYPELHIINSKVSLKVEIKSNIKALVENSTFNCKNALESSVVVYINSDGVFPTGIAVLNRGSYVRNGDYDYRDTYNRKYEKPFNNYNEFVNLNIPYREDYVYVKNDKEYRFKIDSTTGNDGWVCDGLYDFQIQNGTSAEREALITSNNSKFFKKGFEFYDNTLNKPIWWTGSNWVDATGATV